MPPPSVRPATPVCVTIPPVVARPNAWVSRSSSPRARRPEPSPCAPPDRRDPLHRPQVDDDAAVADRVAGEAVPPASHGDREAGAPGEPHRRDHVRDAGAARDQRRIAIDRPVPDPAVLVVGRGRRGRRARPRTTRSARPGRFDRPRCCSDCAHSGEEGEKGGRGGGEGRGGGGGGGGGRESSVAPRPSSGHGGDRQGGGARGGLGPSDGPEAGEAGRPGSRLPTRLFAVQGAGRLAGSPVVRPVEYRRGGGLPPPVPGQLRAWPVEAMRQRRAPTAGAAGSPSPPPRPARSSRAWRRRSERGGERCAC